MAAAAKAGVKNDRGGDPDEQTMRRTWRLVCRAVAAEQAAKAAKPPRKLQPRDMPKDWRPAVIQAATPAPNVPFLPPDVDPTDPFARVRVELDKSSGRRNPEGEKL